MILEEAVRPFRPEFLKDLLEVLGAPSSIRFSVWSKEISSAALKVGEDLGVELEDRYIGGAPVELEGTASAEKLVELYQRDYERWEAVTSLERHAEEKLSAPGVGVDEITWYGRGRGEEYTIKFGRYRLEAEISPGAAEVIRGIIECARRHGIKICMKLESHRIEETEGASS